VTHDKTRSLDLVEASMNLCLDKRARRFHGLTSKPAGVNSRVNGTIMKCVRR
jgi:hypothetical protein